MAGKIIGPKSSIKEDMNNQYPLQNCSEGGSYFSKSYLT